MQVGDAVVGIDHGQGRTGLEGGINGSPDLCGAVGRELLQTGVEIAQAEIRVDPDGVEIIAVPVEDVGQEGTHRVSEEDRVGDLHHRRLEVDRPQQVLLLGQGQGGGIELVEGIDGHVGGVDDLSLEGLDTIGEGGLGAVSPDENDVEVLALGDEGLLVVEEVPMIHVGDASLDLIGPLTHAVRMGLGVRLDGGGGTTVRVTLTQHRVDGRAEHGGVAGGCLLLLVGGGLVREIRQVVSPGLQLSDRGLELWDGGGDVRQLDDVGVRGASELAELGQMVGHLLTLGQTIRELSQDSPGQGDVRGRDVDT